MAVRTIRNAIIWFGSALQRNNFQKYCEMSENLINLRCNSRIVMLYYA